MEQAVQLAALIAADPGPALPDLNPVTGLADTLQKYGPWGLSAILIVAVVVLFRRLEASHKSRDDIREAQVKAQIMLAEEQIRASVESTRATAEIRNAIANFTTTLQAVERRLENVEDKLG